MHGSLLGEWEVQSWVGERGWLRECTILKYKTTMLIGIVITVIKIRNRWSLAPGK